MTGINTGYNVVTVVGRDEVGVIAQSDGMSYYLTECCGASAKGCDGYIGCRACYQEIDPELGGTPDSVHRWDPQTHKLTIERKPLRLTEVYGDGIPYDKWVETVPGLAARQAAMRKRRDAAWGR